MPIAQNGQFEFLVDTNSNEAPNVTRDGRNVRIKQLQMEADSGKIIHGVERELIDLNRAGVGLIEIVTEPDFASVEEAVCFVEQLRLMLMHNSICRGEMHRKRAVFQEKFSIFFDDCFDFRWSITR